MEDLSARDQALNDAWDRLPTSTPVPAAPAGAAAATPLTPRQVAATAEEAQLESGLFTQAGQTSDYLLQAGYLHDLANKGAAFLNNAAKALPDNALTAPIKAGAQMMDDDIGSFEEVKQRSTEAVRQGMESDDPLRRATANLAAGAEVTASALPDLTVQLPLSIGARLANQEAPWMDPPEVVKDNDAAKNAYEIIQVVAPSLLGAGLTGGGAAAVTGKTLLLESALETIPQRAADDLIMGRETAIKMGELATAMGYDGNQLTQDLIEGKKPNAQAWNAAIGLVQNYFTNATATKLLGAFGKLRRGSNVTEVAADSARMTGKTPQQAADALDDIHLPEGNPRLFEPHEMVDVDSSVGVVKPGKGQKFISPDSAAAELARTRRGLGVDDLTAADRNYFATLRNVSDEKGMRGLLKEMDKTLRQIGSNADDLNLAKSRAADWWDSNKHLVSGGMDDLDQLARNFLEGDYVKADGDKLFLENVELVKQGEDAVAATAFMKPDSSQVVETILREHGITTKEGWIAAGLVGEELGVRVQKMARQVVNLDDAGISYEAAVENLITYHQKAQLFNIPFRRGKRAAALEAATSGRSLRRLTDVDVKGGAKKQLSSTAPARSFETISVDKTDVGLTIRELWEKAKNGDYNAHQTLKTYTSILAYSDPSDVLSQVDDLAKVLEKQLADRLPDARRTLHYSYLIGRIRPVSTSIIGGFFNLITGPIGDAIIGVGGGSVAKLGRARAIGGALGSVSGWGAAWDNSLRMMKTGVSTIDPNNTAKIDLNLGDLAARNAELDNNWKGVQRVLNQRNAPPGQRFVAWTNYLQARFANQPIHTYAGRALSAGDEWVKTIYGSQVAGARAFEEFAKNGGDLTALSKKHFDNIFKPNGVMDEEVLEGAKRISLQTPIPRGDDANAVDRLFGTMEDAAQNNFFFNIASPFTRVGWNELSLGAEVLAGSLNASMVPINLPMRIAGRQSDVLEPGTWLLKRVGRYNDIMSGTDELAKQNLRRNLAFGEGWGFSVASLAYFGGITGNQPPEGMPPRSFIIPWGNKQGWKAISYDRIGPAGFPAALLADVVQAFKRGDLTQQGYVEGALDIITSIGMGITDKAFMNNLQETAGLFDVRKLMTQGPRYLSDVGFLLAGQFSGGYGALIRMGAEWTQPYQTISKDPTDGTMSFWRQLGQRVLGGHGNPVLYDPLTGEPEMRTAGANKDNWWASSIGQAFQEIMLPGKTSSKDERNPALDAMTAVDYDWNPRKLIQEVGKVKLTPEQQSIFSEDLHTVGGLGYALEELVTSSPTKENLIALDKARRAGNTEDVLFFKEQIRADLVRTITTVKELTATRGRLSEEIGIQRLAAQSVGNPTASPKIGGTGNSTYDDAMRIIQQTNR